VGGGEAPAAGVPVPKVRLGLRHLAQKDQGKTCYSPRTWFGRSYSAGWPAARSERWVGVELAEEVDAGVPRAPGLHGSTRGVPAEVLLGSRGLGNYR
jgi:hypothetical protein